MEVLKPSRVVATLPEPTAHERMVKMPNSASMKRNHISHMQIHGHDYTHKNTVQLERDRTGSFGLSLSQAQVPGSTGSL